MKPICGTDLGPGWTEIIALLPATQGRSINPNVELRYDGDSAVCNLPINHKGPHTWKFNGKLLIKFKTKEEVEKQ